MIVKSLQTKRGAREGFGLVIAVKHETDVLYYYITHLTFAIPFNWIEVHTFLDALASQVVDMSVSHSLSQSRQFQLKST